MKKILLYTKKTDSVILNGLCHPDHIFHPERSEGSRSTSSELKCHPEQSEGFCTDISELKPKLLEEILRFAQDEKYDQG